MGDGGIDDVFVLKEDSVGHLFRIHLLDLKDMGTIVVRGCVYIPSIYCVVVP